MGNLKRQLGIKDGIALGIGSIMGSGILFLPSFTYGVSGADALIAWGLVTLFCLPLLFFFSDMVKAVPNESGMEGFIGLGLGKAVAASIPILFLGTVGIGMPSAAIIAGKYLHKFIGGHELVTYASAFILVLVSIGANLAGLKTGSVFQKCVAFGLFIIGLALFSVTLPEAIPQLTTVSFDWNWTAILSASVVAFWAYAGFENMTFMAGEFKNPHRDIILSIFISLVLCGFLYIGLTANVVGLVAHSEVDQIAGLYQLSESVQFPTIATFLISAFAVGAVLINLTSWSWGISRLVYSSARKGQLPQILGTVSKNGVPKRSLYFLLAVFSLVIGFAMLNPNLLEKGLVIVSTNFVFLYFLCLLSYVVYAKSIAKKLLGTVLLIGVSIALFNQGWLLAYPVAIVTFSALAHRVRVKNKVLAESPC